MAARPTSAAPIVVLLAAVLLVLGGYTAAYFCLASRSLSAIGEMWCQYPHPALVSVFAPAAGVESLLTRRVVNLADRNFNTTFRVGSEP